MQTIKVKVDHVILVVDGKKMKSKAKERPSGRATPDRISDSQRERIMMWLERGKETEWIQERVGVTRQQVAAVKAHITMGSYEQ